MKDYIHSNKSFKESYDETMQKRKKIDPILKKYFILGTNALFDTADSLTARVPVLGTGVNAITDIATVPANLVADILFNPTTQKITTAIGSSAGNLIKKFVNANIGVYDKMIQAYFAPSKYIISTAKKVVKKEPIRSAVKKMAKNNFVKKEDANGK